MKKICAVCGAVYDAAAWIQLPFLGFQDRGENRLELRNCSCGDTLVIENPDEQPIFMRQHCKSCVFLGNFEGTEQDCYDLYFCPQGSLPTVLARYGNAASEYVSGMSSQLPALKEAVRRARELGHVK